MGSRLRRISIGFWSARLPTVSEIFATRALRSSALARIAFSTAGQYFSWSGVSCNAAFARSIRKSVRVFRSAAFKRSGVAEGVCALASGDAVRKSAVAPSTIIFIISDLLGKVIPQALRKNSLVLQVALIQIKGSREVFLRAGQTYRHDMSGCGAIPNCGLSGSSAACAPFVLVRPSCKRSSGNAERMQAKWFAGLSRTVC